MDYESMAKEFYNCETRQLATEKLLDWITKEEFNYFKFEDALRSNVKYKKQKEYIYMLTYTVDPNKIPNITPDIEQKIVDTIENQGRRTALSVTRYEYVKEYHQNGRPHWHALVITNKILKKDRFSNYINKYGNIDISKNKAQNSADIINYITKVGEITKVI